MRNTESRCKHSRATSTCFLSWHVILRDDHDQEDYIGAINNLQNHLISIGEPLDIKLPEIAVVGGQSAGKSSVLQSLVGKEFLPRGQGLVTRRPTIVQFVPDTKEYGEFAHKPGEIITDFSKISDEIMRATNEECAPNQFSMNPISLCIHSPRVLKLTVVDLPGLIKVPTRDQNEDTVQTVRNMVREYISKETTIILAVAEATADIGTADALEMAKQVDPQGLRTIGVLTKIDTMQKGTNAKDILENTLYPLKRGWVGVINKSPEDIQANRDMDYMLKKEEEIFASGIYCHLKHRMGSVYLQKLLHKTLKEHIKEHLTPTRNAILEKLSSVQKDLKKIENIIGDDGPNRRMFYLHKLINNFVKDIDVKLMGYSELVSSKKLTAGAIIKYILYTEMKDHITSLPLMSSDEEMRILITNLTGVRNSISVPSLAVDAVCRQLIEKFKVPLRNSVARIKAELETAVQDSATSVIVYPSLRSDLIYIIQHWIEEEAEIAIDRLESHIDSRMFYLNLIHPDCNVAGCAPVAPSVGPFNLWADAEQTNLSAGDATSNKHPADNASTSTSKSVLQNSQVHIQMQKSLEVNEMLSKQVNYMKAIVAEYIKIVQKEVLDLAITYVCYFLVKKLNTRISDDLGPTIMCSDNIESLMQNFDADLRRRDELQLTWKKLKQAAIAVKDF